MSSAGNEREYQGTKDFKRGQHEAVVVPIWRVLTNTNESTGFTTLDLVRTNRSRRFLIIFVPIKFPPYLFIVRHFNHPIPDFNLFDAEFIYLRPDGVMGRA
jgi:hypothetical protein